MMIRLNKSSIPNGLEIIKIGKSYWKESAASKPTMKAPIKAVDLTQNVVAKIYPLSSSSPHLCNHLAHQNRY